MCSRSSYVWGDSVGRLRPGIQPKLNALRSLYEGKKIIVARYKLDVVKGVVQKVRKKSRLKDTNRLMTLSKKNIVASI